MGKYFSPERSRRISPGDQEVSHLRSQLMETADDYVVLYLMRGVRDFDDMFLPLPVLAQREEAAWQTANALWDLVERIDALAGTPSLGDEWADLLAAWEIYDGEHEGFKPMRVVAKAWGIDPGDTVTNRGGRPPKFKASEDVLDWIRPQVEAIIKDGSYPAIEMVAAYLDCHENTIRLHIRPYWPDWESVLAALEHKTYAGFV